MEDLMSCKLCYELYAKGRVARVLGCGHTFCEACLACMLERLPRLERRKPRGKFKKLTCPTCRTDVIVEGGCVQSVTVNYVLMGLVP